MSTKVDRWLGLASRFSLPEWLSQWRVYNWLRVSGSELRHALRQDVQSVRIMRYAVGVTLAVALAYSIQWPLAFLTPILTAVILALPLPRPSLQIGLRNMFYTLAAFIVGVVFTLFFLPFPFVYILMLGLVLFHIYYYLNRGGSFWFALMALLSVLILPMLGNNHEGLAFGFALGFIWSGWLTVLMIWIAHFILPDPVMSAPPEPAKFQPAYSASAAEAALKSTLVAVLLAVVFIAFNWIDQLLVMVFAAIFTLSPDLAKSKQAGMDSIISTLMGGIAGWLFYWLIVAVPEFYFFITLMFLTTLLFAQQIFSTKSSAGYYGSGFVVLFVLVNSSLDGGGDISSALIWRLLFISLATIYVIAALKVLECYWPSTNAPNPILE